MSDVPPTRAAAVGGNTADGSGSLPSSQSSSYSYTPTQPTFRNRGKAKTGGPQLKIGKRCRVSTTRKELYHTLNNDQAAVIPTDLPNDHLFYGTVVSGKGDLWTVRWDVLPSDEHGVVKNMKRKKLTVVAPGADEPTQDPRHIHNEEEVHEKSKKKSPWAESIADFCSMSKEALASAPCFWDVGERMIRTFSTGKF